MPYVISGREIITNYDPPPIPTNKFDWSAREANYEGGDPIGHGPTEQAAVDDLLDQLEDQTDDGELTPFPSSAWHGG